ncbi:hypothetical protein NDA12_002020 [Ustilago hordei]|nr:hypothetical protein NDA12_002020 [Ustilago hordei]
MSSAEKNYEIHDKELLAVYQPGDKGGEPNALTRRTDMQPAGEEQDHNWRKVGYPQSDHAREDQQLTLKECQRATSNTRQALGLHIPRLH